MTNNKQIEAVARAMMQTVFDDDKLVLESSLDWCGNDIWTCDFAEMAKAAIDVLRIELSSILHVGGVKHPQQLQWDAMMDELRNLQRQSDSTKYVPMLVDALKFYADIDAEITKMLAGFSATPDMRCKESVAEKALSQLPPELRGE